MRIHYSNRIQLRLLICLLVTAVIAWLVFTVHPYNISADSFEGRKSGSSFLSPRVELENYDIRLDQSAQARSALEEYRQHHQGDGVNPLEVRYAMQRAESSLVERVQGLNVEWNAFLGTPEIVGITAYSHSRLTGPSTVPHEKIVRDFLAAEHSLFGLTQAQVSALKKISDYTNPAGNLSWVEFRQEINGIPVFQGELRAAITMRGELGRTVNNLAPGLDYSHLLTKAQFSATDAVISGAASIGLNINRNDLRVLASDDRHGTFNSATFSDQTRVELVYFPIEFGVATLSWSMVLSQPTASYYVIVDANYGRLLFRKSITFHQSQSATYSVYDNDSPAPLSPSTVLPGAPSNPPGISRSALSIVSELPGADNLGWIPDGDNTTTGNNVDAGLDVEPPDGIDPNGRPVGNPFRVFDFTYNPPPIGNDPPSGSSFRFGSVTNLFFWSNRFHDRLYEAGFTEAAGNFQNNNFGRGGLEHDPLIVEAHKSGFSSPSISTPPDGTSPKLRTGEGTTGDMGLDQEVVLHELAHGVSSRLHGNGAGLGSLQAGAMGEGWSDFYARALLSSADEDLNGYFASSAYSFTFLFSVGSDGYYYGVRRFPYAVKSSVGANLKPHNPLTFADIDPVQINTTDGAYPMASWITNSATEVHNAGEVWCLALLEVRARLIRHHGFVEGNRRALQLVTDGMKLEPLNPRFLQGRDAILAADQLGFNGADYADIWRGFATRGMGTGASSTGTNVLETFSFPVRHRFDFDGDSKTDFAVFRASEGQWYVRNSSNNMTRAQVWGISSDVITPGDYDADGKADLAVFRPADGTWYILQSSSSTLRAQVWGANGDVPVPGDYDGDGRDDLAVFRGGVWYILQSSTNSLRVQLWGLGTDRPVVGDFDGDARTDLAVFRPGNGTWYVFLSSTNASISQPFGLNGDLAVVGDYDGDGWDDMAVFRNGTWYIKQSLDGTLRAENWGIGTDRPVPGDFDGDGKTDLAIFRPSSGTWFVLQSSTATVSAFKWGQNGDAPIPSAFIP